MLQLLQLLYTNLTPELNYVQQNKLCIDTTNDSTCTGTSSISSMVVTYRKFSNT